MLLRSLSRLCFPNSVNRFFFYPEAIFLSVEKYYFNMNKYIIFIIYYHQRLMTVILTCKNLILTLLRYFSATFFNASNVAFLFPGTGWHFKNVFQFFLMPPLFRILSKKNLFLSKKISQSCLQVTGNFKFKILSSKKNKFWNFSCVHRTVCRCSLVKRLRLLVSLGSVCSASAPSLDVFEYYFSSDAGLSQPYFLKR